ncbi:MAG: peptide chain release factor N(5)-glutamine methyltransferase [Treponema sp.]|nr:peptide chain release factor N(5)-glutamine methyltransferase [Treponema sp.]
MTVLQAKIYGKNKLTASPSPQLDTEVILQHVTGLDKTRLLFERDTELSPEQEKSFLESINLRTTGLPVAYIISEKEFYGYNYYVTPDVLIPKPDTEILVEKAVEILDEKINSKLHSGILSICDMCTGSGCVGLSILKYSLEHKIIPEHNIPLLILADISSAALNIARKNAARLFTPEEAANIRFIQTNLFDSVPGNFDIIVSNPPYIPAEEVRNLLTDGRNEPVLALDGDIDLNGNPTLQNDGLGIMRNLVPQAVSRLTAGGALLCESGEYNAQETEELFRQNGLTRTKIHRDLEGQLRVTEGFKNFSGSF